MNSVECALFSDCHYLQGDARWALEEYVRWLPQFLKPFLRCDVLEDGRVLFCLRFLSTPLLDLRLRQGGDEHRKVLDIIGGLLADTQESQEGRLEFREVLDGKYVIAAITTFAQACHGTFTTQRKRSHICS